MKRLFVILISALMFFASPVSAGTLHTSETLASAIIADARYLLNDTNSAKEFWSDAELLVWLNYGLKDIAARAHCFEGIETITLIEAEIDYPIRADYLKIISCAYKTTAGAYKGLREIEKKDIGGKIEDIDTPSHWSIWDKNFAISPLPSSTVAGDSVIIHFVYNPKTISLTANIPNPAIYDRALVLFIAANARIKSGDLNKYLNEMQLYNDELDRYRMDFGAQTKED